LTRRSLLSGLASILFALLTSSCGRLDDLIASREMVGRVNNVRVRVPLRATDTEPVPGQRVLIHAPRFSDIV
jgi:hypothetical protein